MKTVGLPSVAIFQQKHLSTGCRLASYPPKMMKSESLMVANPALLKKIKGSQLFRRISAVIHCLAFWLQSSMPQSQALTIISLHLNEMLEPPHRLSVYISTLPVLSLTRSTEVRYRDSSSRSDCPQPPKMKISPFLSWQRVWLLLGITFAKSFLVTWVLMLYRMNRGLFDLALSYTKPPDRQMNQPVCETIDAWKDGTMNSLIETTLCSPIFLRFQTSSR